MQLAEGGRVSDLGVAGIPLGFDAEGRLVFWDGCRPGGLSRVDGAGKGELLVDGAAEARVTPSGRYTIALSRNPADLSDHEIRVVDLLGDGDWSFRLEGDWRLTRLGDDRYGVLEGAASGTPAELQMLVVSLEGRWVGALPTPASPQPSR